MDQPGGRGMDFLLEEAFMVLGRTLRGCFEFDLLRKLRQILSVGLPLALNSMDSIKFMGDYRNSFLRPNAQI